MNSTSLLTQRWLFLSAFVLCVILMATALVMQHLMGLEPCPLCILQRVFVIALGATMLVAAIHDPRIVGRRVYAALTVMLGALGVIVAGRHVWLQNLPADQVPDCGPGLEYMLEAFPLVEALELVFRGSGECAEVQWVFLGLTIPGWSLVIFVGLTIFGLALAFTRFGMPGGRNLNGS